MSIQIEAPERKETTTRIILIRTRKGIRKSRTTASITTTNKTVIRPRKRATIKHYQ